MQLVAKSRFSKLVIGFTELLVNRTQAELYLLCITLDIAGLLKSICVAGQTQIFFAAFSFGQNAEVDVIKYNNLFFLIAVDINK